MFDETSIQLITPLWYFSPRQTADLFAEAGYLVVMPDFYRGTWKVREATWPRNISSSWTFSTLKVPNSTEDAWRHSRAVWLEKILKSLVGKHPNFRQTNVLNAGKGPTSLLRILWKLLWNSLTPLMTIVAGPHWARCGAVYQGSDPVVQAAGDDVHEDKQVTITSCLSPM